MRTPLSAEDETVIGLEGGAPLEWCSTPGVASAILQVVLLPPNLRFPDDGAPAEAAAALAAAGDDPTTTEAPTAEEACRESNSRSRTWCMLST